MKQADVILWLYTENRISGWEKFIEKGQPNKKLHWINTARENLFLVKFPLMPIFFLPASIWIRFTHVRLQKQKKLQIKSPWTQKGLKKFV